MDNNEKIIKNQEFIICNEDDAYRFLKSILEETLDLNQVEITFEGWPKLHIHMVGDKYHQTITPTIMKGFMELQQSLYRTYTLSLYNTPNTRVLKKEEKEDLEIKVKVTNGSSNYDIDLQEIFIKLIEKAGDKMEPVHIIVMVVATATLYFGNSAYKSYLENRKDIREKELKNADQKALIESLKFASQQETERTKIIAGLIDKKPQLINIENNAHDAHTSLIKGIAAGEECTIQGIQIDPEVARILTANARKKSEEIRLDGHFKILRVDSTDPTEFKVRVRNIVNNEVLDAIVQDSSLDQHNKPILQEAEWSRKPVELKINAKMLDNEIKNAVVIGVERVDETFENDHPDK